ncbi:hypothetical protein [Anaerovorax odorimutans]|uniref:hypothetical protein n=1 Tax=Anaerovorax odorimutans TaxID=109327 RepID=UPI00041D28A9|nr:hypothetical protein [Anaerovorax odorimutans]
MSVAGTYKVQVKTPRGVGKGKMILVVEGELLKGTLEYPTGVSKIANGKVKGNTIEFVTKIKTPIGNFRAFVTGEVKDNIFSGMAKLSMGSVQIYGKKD